MTETCLLTSCGFFSPGTRINACASGGQTDSFSNSFPVSNGVRQGGVLSPILFTIYLDDLLTRLSNLGVGCYWDSFFAGAFCYADDLALLAPSPAALRLLLRCCEDFAAERGLRFNPSKTQLIRFPRSPSSCCSIQFFFCGQLLQFSDTVMHLGHQLLYNLSDSQDILLRMRDMVRKANCLFATFPRVGPFILTRLFQSYCMSLYGSSLWALSCPAIHNLEIAYNKILRRIWRLPNRRHTGISFTVWLIWIVYSMLCHGALANSLRLAASRCSSTFVQSIFQSSALSCYSFCGYNSMFASRHLTVYPEQYRTEMVRLLTHSANGTMLAKIHRYKSLQTNQMHDTKQLCWLALYARQDQCKPNPYLCQRLSSATLHLTKISYASNGRGGLSTIMDNRARGTFCALLSMAQST